MLLYFFTVIWVLVKSGKSEYNYLMTVIVFICLFFVKLLLFLAARKKPTTNSKIIKFIYELKFIILTFAMKIIK
jgi:uncharacterized Tic20 family protein